MKFEKGDKVRIEGESNNLGEDWTGLEDYIITTNQQNNHPFTVFLKSGKAVRPEKLILIKEEGKEMSIKDKIENINEDTTLKELDDLLVEISDKVNEGWRGLYIGVHRCATEIGFINNDGKVIKCVNFKTQCEKLKALKDALMWLAEKSGKLKDNKKEIEELKKQFNLCEEQMEEIHNKIERLEE